MHVRLPRALDLEALEAWSDYERELLAYMRCVMNGRSQMTTQWYEARARAALDRRFDAVDRRARQLFGRVE